MIRSGRITEVTKDSGFWVFVDLGFSQNNRSCGILVHDDPEPQEVTFAVLLDEIVNLAKSPKSPLNLLLEAPLSIVFNKKGNPSGRTIEKKPGFQPRYWYLGLGCCVLTAATHLLRKVVENCPETEIRLFEGFASFKKKGEKSSHKDDVLALRKAVWDISTSAATMPKGFSETDRIESAFHVAEMDFGIPPIITVDV